MAQEQTLEEHQHLFHLNERETVYEFYGRKIVQVGGTYQWVGSL